MHPRGFLELVEEVRQARWLVLVQLPLVPRDDQQPLT